jgi:tight adherence protein C
VNAALLLSAALVALAARPDGRPRLRRTGAPDPVPRLFVAVGRRLAPLGALPDPPQAAAAGDLARAGVEHVVVADLPALRRGAVAVFGGAGLAAVLLSPRLVVAAAVPVVAVLGWLHPELWLHSRARRRAAQIEDQAPLVLDLVAVSVSAGATVGAALDGAGAVAAEPLRAELRRLAASMALGGRRTDELRQLSARTGAPTVQRLAAALGRADRLGVPVAGELRMAAETARRERGHAVAERAAEAGPRILLVVVFLLVPAALLPVITAVALSAVDALRVAV